jgi:hypothetical protein
VLGQAWVADVILPEAHARASLDDCSGRGGRKGVRGRAGVRGLPRHSNPTRRDASLPAHRLATNPRPPLPSPPPPVASSPRRPCPSPGPNVNRNRSQPWQSRARNCRDAAEIVMSVQERRKTAPSTGPEMTVMRAQVSMVSWEAHPRSRTVQSRRSDRETWGGRGREGGGSGSRGLGGKRVRVLL